MAISFFKRIFGGDSEERNSEAETRKEKQRQRRSQAASNNAGEAGDPAVDLSGLEAFVEYVVKALVDAPEKVSLESVEKERITIIQVRCEKSDIGKIIGKSGKTIAAIRSLVSSAAGRSGLRVSVDVLD
mgnify:CR=1 FL=1|jgi:predicted RNA-binding protein YlqC (UPF0109 family)